MAANDTHLEDLRRAELAEIVDRLAPDARILEIGGGNGFQASLLRQCGFQVCSIDVQPVLQGRRYFVVTAYDGQHVPAADEAFDVVFSSNTLEHVQPIRPFLQEVRRVLRRGGLAVHVLPSPTWRLWTSVALFGHALRRLSRIRSGPRGAVRASTASNTGGSRRLLRMRSVFVPLAPHGEYPTAPSELYYFSRLRWTRLFRDCGFYDVEVSPTGIFYTGYALFPWLPLAARRRLGQFLGSATNVFVMRRDPDLARSQAP